MSGKLRRRSATAGCAMLTGAVLAAGALPSGLAAQGAKKRSARAAVVNAAGKTIGTVRFDRGGRSRAVRVTVRVRQLPPGFHGFHVHAVGRCQAPGFTSAGPHLNPAGANHPQHAGDMPPLLVTRRGEAEARFVTDRFSIADLRDADGSAVIVHAQPDNQANIPPDRYDPDPDQMTLDTGDSGPRLACGRVR